MKAFFVKFAIGSKKCIIRTVYRSPGQNSDKPESFQSNFEFLLQDISSCKPYLTLLLGIIIQEIQSGGIKIIQQLKGLNLKLPQLFTGSNN